jgi:hypothetical protein
MLTRDEYPDVLVTVAHPSGDVDVPLPDWIREGPGPRPYVGIIRARRSSSGDEIPLKDIPLEYHNSAESRRLQRVGELDCVWGPPPAREP